MVVRVSAFGRDKMHRGPTILIAHNHPSFRSPRGQKADLTFWIEGILSFSKLIWSGVPLLTVSSQTARLTDKSAHDRRGQLMTGQECPSGLL